MADAQHSLALPSCRDHLRPLASCLALRRSLRRSMGLQLLREQGVTMPKLVDDVVALEFKPPASLSWKEDEVSQVQDGLDDSNIKTVMGLVCGSFGIADFGKGQTVTHLPTQFKIKELNPLSPGQMKRCVAVLVAQLNWKDVTRSNVLKKVPRWIPRWCRLCGEAGVCIPPEDCPELQGLAR